MIYADLHAHSFLCAFQQRVADDAPMSRNPNDEDSVWHQFPVQQNIVHALGEAAGFTTYSESDFTQAVITGVKLVNIALYPPERGFFQLDDKTFLERLIKWLGLQNFAEVELGHLISGFSTDNIRHIKSPAYEYLSELRQQADFVLGAQPHIPDAAGCVGTVYSNIKNASYLLVQSGDELNADPLNSVIQVLLSVEGGNSLWSNMMINGGLWDGSNFDSYLSNEQINGYQVLNVPDWRNAITPAMVETPATLNPLVPQEVCDILLTNTKQILSNYKLFSFTFAHHFYNGLAGHCASLQPLTDLKLVDQSFGLGSDITNAGYIVLNELLKNNVIIDVKHMSYNARQSFYRYRANNYSSIPIIASHAAVYGAKIIGGTPHAMHGDQPFYAWEINLYDDDIYEIIASGGMVGVLMDQRVTGVQASGNIDTLWLQFKYIAERAAESTRTPGVTVWDFMCLGTDYDGIIHPVDQFTTYDDLLGNDFVGFIQQRLQIYMQAAPANFQQQDILQPQEIVSKICFKNLNEFVMKHYR